jgi:hypothetical protein
MRRERERVGCEKRQRLRGEKTKLGIKKIIKSFVRCLSKKI